MISAVEDMHKPRVDQSTSETSKQPSVIKEGATAEGAIQAFTQAQTFFHAILQQPDIPSSAPSLNFFSPLDMGRPSQFSFLFFIFCCHIAFSHAGAALLS